MKLIRMIGRDIRDAIKSVFRNMSLSMASISCITITLILVALAVALAFNINNFTKLMQDQFTIVVFLDKNTTVDEIKEVEHNIKELSNVESCDFRSKKDIADSMMETSEIYKNIMESWDENENPLKDTFILKVKDINVIDKTAGIIDKIDNVDLTQYGEAFVSKFVYIFKVIEQALIVTVVVFVLVTAFLISNTIKLTIFSRRREIEIMRLVGASNFNIELPFVVEGLILGVLGSIVPIVTVIYGYSALYMHFNGQVLSPFMKLVTPEPFIYIISLILLIIGILVGMFGSFRAVGKYLKI